MAQFPLFNLGLQGRSSNVNAGERLNLYLGQPQDGDKMPLAAYPTPGLSVFSQGAASAPIRGIWYMNAIDRLYIVQQGTLYEVDHTGVATSRGTLNGADVTGNCSICDNGTQVIVVTGSYGYIYDTGTHAFSQIASAFPGGNTVTFLDSYFIVNRPGTGQFWISSQYDGTAWNGLNYATAESNPDNLVRVEADRGTLVLFGAYSTEIWADTGALDFPFQRINGATAEFGLTARWSLARCNGQWVGLFTDRQGQLAFRRLTGYSLEKISPDGLDSLLNTYGAPSDAVGFAYTMNGHAFYQVSFQQAAVTWLYDATMGAWSKLQSYGLTRHLGDLGAAFGATYITTDYANGVLYWLNPAVYTDNGAPIAREVIGSHLFSTQGLNETNIRRLRVDMEAGVGLISSQGSDPTVMLQISRDGGHTWGRELWTTWGKIGEYGRRAEWRRLGQSRDWLFKVRITDPVKTVLIGAFVEAEECQA